VGLLGIGQRHTAQQREIAIEVHEGSNLTFDLSPDGRWIMLDLVGQLWKLPAGGGEAVPLTDAVRDSAEAHDPRWSPDGTRVVFWRGFEPDFTYGVRPLWMLTADSGRARALVADTVRFIDPAWHPSGRSLLVVHSSSRIRPDDRLYLYDLSTGALSLVPADSLPSNRGRRLAAPAWSPDGRTIAVVDGRSAGPIWEVDVASGTAVRITPDGVQAGQPVYAPDGTSIAYVQQDAVGNAEIWVQDRGGGARRQITATTAGAQSSTNPVGRVAWAPDGQRLILVRYGRLWSVDREGGAPTEIPFTATIRFTQERPAPPPLQFPAPGSEQRARGFTGIALAPDAGRVALIALDSLWLITLDGRATGITGVRQNAKGLTWSPDGRTLAWSGGPKGEEDVYATDIATGATQSLTALPGQELRPAWSPDGRRLAFLHTGPEIRGAETRLRVLATDGVLVERPDQTMDLGPAPGAGPYTPLDIVPQWSRDGSSVLLAQPGGEVLLVPLEGDRRTLNVPPAASSIRRFGEDSVVFLLEDRLYAARLRSDSTAIAEGRLITEVAALYPAVARDGSVLYVSDDGLRVQRPDGSTARLGWPIRFRTPTPSDLVIRNVRLVDGQGGSGELSDIVIANGRIERITLAGRVPVAVDAQVVDADGRFVIPGLIELHQHPGSEAQLRGALYFGITTIREMGNSIAIMAAWRDALTAGAIPGPRMVVAGFLFYPGCVAFGGAQCQFTEFEQNPSDDSAAARGLALAQAFGIGTVKMYSPGSLSAARRFIEMAHRLGLPVTGHAGHNLPLLASGMDGKEHIGSGLFPAAYGDVAALARAAGLVITPTLALVRCAKDFASDTAIFSNPELAAFTDPADRRWYSGPPFVASRIPEMERIIRDNRAQVRRLHDAGVTLGAGTDIVAPPWALHTELEELVASGLTPAEALAAATSTAARVLGAEREIGTVAPGRIADLVILDADPLLDIRNTRRIWGLIQGGRVVDRDALLHVSRD
jgi:Tol biopolymer transport system component/imidazolonepropionase-like amidohydrolase